MAGGSEQFDDNDPSYQAARRHVMKLKAFYMSLGVYLIVNLLLIAIDIVGGGGWWFYWVTIFWGIGIAFQGFGVFADGWGKGWEDRKVREAMERDN